MSDSYGDVPDGAGCTEIWDYLSERRRRQDKKANQ